MNQRRLVASIGFVVVLGLLQSCPAPFQQRDLTAGFDTTPPELTLTAPLDGDSYGSVLLVSGTVGDRADGEDDGELSSLSCGVRSLMGATDITARIDDDGGFQYLVDCGQFSGSIVLELIARDWNGNERNLTVNLTDATSDIDSFHLTPGNATIEIAWDSVPGVESYVLYEYVSGFSVDLTADDTSYSFTGPADDPLRNGDTVLFQLKAMMEGDYRDAWSDTLTCVPLSEFTLMPFTSSGNGVVEVEWYDAPAVERYTVLRATERDGDYLVHRIVNDNSFVDTDVVPGQVYFYRVHPDGQDDIVSGVAPGAPHSISTLGLHVAETLLTPSSAAKAAFVSGTDLFVIDRAGVAGADGAVSRYDITDPDSPVLTESLQGSFGGWHEYNAAIDQDGVIYAQWKDDSGGEPYAKGIKVIGTDGTLTLANNLEIPSDDPEIKSFVTVGDLFYYASSRENEFAYVETATLASTSSAIDDIDTLVTEGSLSMDFNSPRVITSYNDGSHDYLYIADGYTLDDIGDGSGNLTNGINIFSVALDDIDHQPTSATALGSDVFFDAYTDYQDSSGSVGWMRPPAALGYDATWIVAADGLLVVVAEMGKESDYDDPNYGVAIYDISAPAAPVYRSSFMVGGTRGFMGKPAVDGNRLIVCDAINGEILIYDVSAPSDPYVVQVIDAAATYPSSLEVTDSHYYVPSEGRLFVLDKAVPGSNNAVDVTPSGMTSPPVYVAIDGDRAYTLDADGLVSILDVTAGPASPVLVGTHDVNLTASGAFTNSLWPLGSVLAVCSPGGVTLVDVSDTSNPVVLTTILDGEQGTGVQRYGDVIFISTRLGRMYAFDISDPAAPEHITMLLLAGIPNGRARDAATIAYTLDTMRVSLIDLSDPYEPDVIATEDTLTDYSQAAPMGIVAVDDYYYTGYWEMSGGQFAGIGTIDATNRTSPVELTDASRPVTITAWADGEDYAMPLQLMRIADDMLIAGIYFWEDDGSTPAIGAHSAHLISIADRERPVYVSSLGVDPGETVMDWFGDWGYFAVPDGSGNGLYYLGLGR